MTKITFGSTFGNFKWSGELELTDAQLVEFASLGGLQVYQRSPSSNAEKTLGKYEKRPDDFKRNSIVFSDANAETLKAALSEEVKVSDTTKVKLTNVSVAFHEIGATTAPKYVEEKTIAKRHVDAGDFAQWMANTIGFKATVEDVDNVEVLQAIKAYKTKMLATV